MKARLARWLCSVLLSAAVCYGWPASAFAHAIDSASLSLFEVAPGRFSVRFQVGSETLRRELEAPAVFPAPCELRGDLLDCGRVGLVGPIGFPWLEGSMTKLMVEIQWLGGARLLRVVSPSSPTLTVYGIPASAGVLSLWPMLSDYAQLGIEHILTGFDHVLFVIALTLLVRGRAALLATISAFTLAHSLSLAATALDLVRLPTPPVEASIALSIVLVCAECLRPTASLTRRAPWLVAFAFGLLHGMGFASALLGIGLPEQHIPTALLGFNIGVELGQLGIVAGVVAIKSLGRRLDVERVWPRSALIYAMGGASAFWFFERLPALFGR